MAKAVAARRWRIAQFAEKFYWKRAKDAYAGVAASVWLPLAKAATMWNNTVALGFSLNSFADKTVVEIGCGPAGISTVLNATVKIGLDPLASTYRREFRTDMDECQYLTARGEDVPIRDNSADVIFCVNVLDHVMDPNSVLRETKRILRTDGILILGLTVQSEVVKTIGSIKQATAWYSPVSKTIKGLKDSTWRKVAHPHEFEDQEISKMVTDFGFIIERCFLNSALQGQEFETSFMTIVCRRRSG
jgi:ubiquinone/menaquinone biosynthesis C-methylase UbiE